MISHMKNQLKSDNKEEKSGTRHMKLKRDWKEFKLK